MWVPLLACPAVRLNSKITFENDDRKSRESRDWTSQQWHPRPDISWWDRLPACLRMTGKMPVPLQDARRHQIIFLFRHYF